MPNIIDPNAGKGLAYFFPIELRDDCAAFQLPDDMLPLRQEPRLEGCRHSAKVLPDFDLQAFVAI